MSNPFQVPTRFTKRQEEILDALEATFLVEGFHGLTLADLAKQLRCSLRSLYQIAPTKEELFLLVLDRSWKRVRDHARHLVVDHDDPAAQVALYMSHGAQTFGSVSRAFLEDVQSYGPARQLFQAHLDSGTAFLAQIIQAGIEQGRFRPVSAWLAANALQVLGLQVFDEAFLETARMDAVQAAQHLTDLVLQGLAIEAEPAPTTKRKRAPSATRARRSPPPDDDHPTTEDDDP